MKIVVIGGTGLIGSKVVANLQSPGHEAVAASPNSGVNTLTGEGLAEALEGAEVVVDVSNSPSFEDADVLEFFETSTRNILDARCATPASATSSRCRSWGANGCPTAATCGRRSPRRSSSRTSGIPYSIVHATQFFEFVGRIADEATDDGTVRLPPVLFQPAAAADVAAMVADVAIGSPTGTIEIGGPEQFRFDELVRRHFAAHGDSRVVVADPHARYFNTELDERSLVPGDGARPCPRPTTSGFVGPHLRSRSYVCGRGSDVRRTVPGRIPPHPTA